MTTLRERLKESRKKAGKTQAEVAEAVKMSQPAYQALESGKNQKSSFLPQIARFLNVDITWLQTGENNASTTTPHPTQDEVYISPLKFSPSYENKNTVRIPVHKDVKAYCGNGVANFLEEVTDYLDIDSNILKLLGIKSKPENLRVIYSAEYSMWPTVSPDSPLFVDISPIDTDAMINGDVYVFLHNGCLRMKRIFVSYGNERTVRLQSDNPDKNKYPDEIVSKEQLNELSFVGRLESALVKP
ncbi:XRE family transcriptional regulator [Acinetobacter higginsii]|uniref:XRE family transcriptional regulator n=1 Tax=Acinetobacter higginsii TaxID=70347 RepID=UPI001F4A1998|nr:LexA family transcriptional regulator [Acinetobacter higginsii]MCH7381299.1 LexA family transcriptional regulator [Acinetobacter higginsii]